MSYRSSVSAIALLAALSAATTARAADEIAPQSTVVEALTVAASNAKAQELGGSAAFIGAEELEAFAHQDVNRILRTVPGVFLQEEEGFGLRPNIGIRGSGTDRASRVAIMEDGVLVAPAPYAAPAAYYFPRMARMSGVEVVKGPGAIKYGPLTTGGAIHFFTPSIPDEGRLSGALDLLGGEYGALQLEAFAGGWAPSSGPLEFGGTVHVLRESSDGFKVLDSGGPTGFEVDDLVIKLGARTTGAANPQMIEVKYQTSDETSDETYLGLTLADFGASPYRRYRGSAQDVMNVDHSAWQVTHRIGLGERWDLTTVAYANDTTRAWYKLNDVASGGALRSIASVLDDPITFAEGYATLVGAPGYTSPASALRVRNNNRMYEAEGIQSVLSTRLEFGGAKHAIEASVRYHTDSEDRFQQDDRYQMVNGQMVLTTAGAPGSQENRTGYARAVALFVRDTIEFGDFTVTPGLRYEQIDLRRVNYALGDVTRATPTSVNVSDLEVWIPGLSVLWQAAPQWQVFGGAHRGFSNPGPGSNAEAETSWNYEAGARFSGQDLLVEAIVFVNDYDNMVGTCTASTGGGCNIGDQFDGGEVVVRGIELTAAYDVGQAMGWGLGAPVRLTYTHTDGEFQTSFNNAFFGAVTAGDELPYLPETQLTLGAGLRAERWRADVTLNHVSDARAEPGSGAIPADRLVEARTLIDIAGEFDITDQVSLFGAVTNLTDEVYNVAFAPAGARPGAPRMAKGGVRLRF